MAVPIGAWKWWISWRLTARTDEWKRMSQGTCIWNSNLDVIKASKPSAEFYSDYSASRFLRNYQWNKKTIIIEDSGLFEVYFRWWMTWMTWISHGFFSLFFSAGMWSTTWPVDDQRRSNNQLGVNGWCRAPPSNGSIPCLRKEASPVSGFKGWIWSPIWMLKDVERWWKMIPSGKRLRNELERSTMLWKWGFIHYKSTGPWLQ